MLCVDAGKGAELPTGADWIMEPKLDGWRFIFEVDEHKVRAWGGRNGRDHSGQAVEVETHLLDRIPSGTVLDGELVSMDGDLEIVTALTGKGTGLAFVVFDVLRVVGSDTRGYPWTARRQFLENVVADIDTPFVRLMPYVAPNEKTFNRWIALGNEGAVCKKRKSVYRSGRRNSDWRKFKPQSTAEAVITGWKWGQGVGNRQRCASITFRMLDTGAESSTGYSCTPEEADTLIGHAFEMLHHGIFPSGKPRHPIFWRMRPDRDGEIEQQGS
jgi:bifunctional non-homologous end joining protein LigD